MTFLEPPCRDCEFRTYPKNGRWISITKGGVKDSEYRRTKNYKPNPCHYMNCEKPSKYADWIASIFIVPPVYQHPDVHEMPKGEI
jgi:hypothetical protein